MDIYEKISSQIEDMALPLYAVTLTAVARADTPPLLMMHWHGLRRETPLRLQGVCPPYRSVPGSAMQINESWQSVQALDSALLDAAWRLGAWDLERVERRGCNQIGASAGEALACRQAFGDYPDHDGAEHVIAEAPDREDLMQRAARSGYVRWQFRPVKGGLWAEVHDEDDTLAPDGTREPPCPVAPLPPRGGVCSRTVYRLGRVDHIILP